MILSNEDKEINLLKNHSQTLLTKINKKLEHKDVSILKETDIH
jgi:hypothetical protein